MLTPLVILAPLSSSRRSEQWFAEQAQTSAGIRKPGGETGEPRSPGTSARVTAGSVSAAGGHLPLRLAMRARAIFRYAGFRSMPIADPPSCFADGRRSAAADEGVEHDAGDRIGGGAGAGGAETEGSILGACRR